MEIAVLILGLEHGFYMYFTNPRYGDFMSSLPTFVCIFYFH